MFPIFARLRVRQWLPLCALFLATVGAAVGAVFGQPNSWTWFIGGGLVAVLIGIMALAGRRGRAQSRAPRA